MEKIFVFISFIIFTCGAGYSQNDTVSSWNKQNDVATLFDWSEIESHGVYISVGAGFGALNGSEYYESSFSSAWVVNHKFALGFDITGYVAEVNLSATSLDDVGVNAEFEGNTYGLLCAPIFFHKKAIHFTVPIVIGVGFVRASSYKTDIYNDRYIDVMDDDGYISLKPGIEAEINLHRFIRLGIKAQYQYALGVNLNHNGENNKNSLNGMSGGISLKFGLF